MTFKPSMRGAFIPLPVTFVSTISEVGVRNVAPYSCVMPEFRPLDLICIASAFNRLGCREGEVYCMHCFIAMKDGRALCRLHYERGAETSSFDGTTYKTRKGSETREKTARQFH